MSVGRRAAGTRVVGLLDRRNPLIAASGGRRPIPVVPFAALAVVALAANAFGPPFVRAFFYGRPSPSEEPVLAAVELFAELVVGWGPVFLFLWAWLRFFEGRPFGTVGFARRGRVARKISLGVLVAIVLLAATTALNAALGGISVERDPAGPSGVGALGGVLFVATGWAVQGSAEEAAFRGWVLQTLSVRLGVPAGALLSSLGFAAMHLQVSGWTAYYLAELFLFGIFCSLYALYEGSLWGVCALHAAWNWAFANVLGLEDHGRGGVPGGALVDLRDTETPLLPEALPSGPTTGNLAGIAVHLLAIIAVLALARRRARNKRQRA